jgi:hypothetical protein
MGGNGSSGSNNNDAATKAANDAAAQQVQQAAQFQQQQQQFQAQQDAVTAQNQADIATQGAKAAVGPAQEAGQSASQSITGSPAAAVVPSQVGSAFPANNTPLTGLPGFSALQLRAQALRPNRAAPTPGGFGGQSNAIAATGAGGTTNLGGG